MTLEIRSGWSDPTVHAQIRLQRVLPLDRPERGYRRVSKHERREERRGNENFIYYFLYYLYNIIYIIFLI
jgi:hypothetical protein